MQLSCQDPRFSARNLTAYLIIVCLYFWRFVKINSSYCVSSQIKYRKISSFDQIFFKLFRKSLYPHAITSPSFFISLPMFASEILAYRRVIFVFV